MTKPIKIDFVSDVSCPFCIIGLHSLEAALERLGDLVAAEIQFQPFELNPDMSSEGQNAGEHFLQKLGRAVPAETRQAIQDRAAEVGFAMRTNDETRIYNSFDAHRLLHWAGLEGRQAALKHRLFELYFTEGGNPSDRDALVDTAAKAGLDAEAAREVLTSGRYADEVRVAEQHWRAAGINAVPSVVINDRYLITGGQPVETFEQALRTIAEA